VTAGPADHHIAAGHHTAAGRGCLRASHADREHVIDVLKAAFVQGRLTKDELDARAGQAFAARTSADLAALTADLPAGLAVARAARRPARAPARPPVTKAVIACAGAATAPALTLIAFGTDSESLAKWVFLVAVVYIVAWLAAGAQMLDTWYQRRSR
jgi:predicted RNA-binding Zn ribbon-like protein